MGKTGEGAFLPTILNKVKNDTLLLAGDFENLEIYQLDPAKFVSAPGLTWEAALKNIKVKLNLLADIDMLLMVERN